MSLHASKRLKRWQLIALTFLLIAGIINFLDRASLSIANSTISKELGFSATQMGLLLSVFSFGYALCQLPIGMVMERFGVKKIYGFGLFLWSLAQTVTGLLSSFTHLIIARVILGIGEAPHLPTVVKVVNDWYNIRERGLPMGIVNMSSTLAQALAPPLLIALMLAFGWRTMFIIIGISGIILSILWFIFYRNREQLELTDDELNYLNDGAPPSSTNKVSFKEWASLFKQRSLWGMIIGFNGVGYMVWLYLTWLPAYLENSRGLSLEKTGWVAAIPFLFGALGMLVNGVVADYVVKRGADKMKSRKWMICLGLLFAAMFTLPAAYTDSTFSAVACISMALFSIHFAGTSAWGLILVSVPSRLITSVSGIQNFGGFIGGSFAPIITGIIIDQTHSFTLALVVCATVAFLASLVYFFFVNEPIKDPAEMEVKVV
ncbi:MFS transporter [Providencia hangzhouensis]|uniref:MFS transporter n=1 Tax=Providencia hangzhouensis TaxID=3031799 RepID=UPI0034DCE459